MQPPLPEPLKHLSKPDAPKHIKTTQVAVLVEFWGFTQSGRDFVRKLERCGVLKPKTLKHQRHKFWSTEAVLNVWRIEQK